MGRKKLTYSVADNREVVLALRRGEQDSFEALYRYYYKPLCAYATRFVTSERAEELVQDTMLWLWENRESIIEDMPVKSLLFTIVKNKALNSATRATLRHHIMDSLTRQLEGEFDDPDFYLENELARRLDEALAKLPPEFAETFRLHRIDGMKHKEIAQCLNVSPQTVNYRIGQTVRFLRYELKDILPFVLFLLYL